MYSKLIGAVGMAVLLAVSASAHHPFSAEYDWQKPVTVTGTVTKVEWANPHTQVFVDVKDSQGKTTNWAFEMGSVSALTKVGWTKTLLKMGDMVTVNAWMAKSRSNMGNVKSVKLPDGRELSGASSIVDANASDVKSPARTD